MLSFPVGNTGNKICCFQKSPTGRKMWSQRISATLQVVLLVGYCTALKIQTNLKRSVCQWAGRAPPLEGDQDFVFVWKGRGFVWLVYFALVLGVLVWFGFSFVWVLIWFGLFVFCLCWLLTCTLPTLLRLPQSNSRFSVAETTSTNTRALLNASVMGDEQLFCVPQLTGCTEHPRMWVQACVCPGQASPGKTPSDLRFQGSLSHALWFQVSPRARGTSFCSKCKCQLCIFCRFCDNRLVG